MSFIIFIPSFTKLFLFAYSSSNDLARPKDDEIEGGSSTNTETFELSNEHTKSDDSSLEQQQLSYLPFDALVQVSSHLAPLDYMNFRATSRICRSAIPPIKWRNPLFGSQTSIPVPFLMSVENGSLYKYVDPRSNSRCNTYQMKIPDSLSDAVIRYSHRGWVLTLKKDAINLYNAFTGDIISVTSTDDGSARWNHSIFFAPRRDGGFLAVRILFWYCESVDVFVIVPGDERWTYYSLECNKAFGTGRTQSISPVLFGDAFYYLDDRGNLGKLGIVEMDDEYPEVSWELLEKPSTPCHEAFDECFLVESDGNLLSVFVGRAGKRVSVYRLDSSRMVWETVSSLGDSALYLSRASSVSVRMSPELGNRIYFARSCDSGIAFFSLKTGKWHFSGDGNSSRDLYGTKLHHNSCWIMPE